MTCNKTDKIRVLALAKAFAKANFKKIIVVKRGCNYNFYEPQFVKKTDIKIDEFDFIVGEESEITTDKAISEDDL